MNIKYIHAIYNILFNYANIVWYFDLTLLTKSLCLRSWFTFAIGHEIMAYIFWSQREKEIITCREITSNVYMTCYDMW